MRVGVGACVCVSVAILALGYPWPFFLGSSMGRGPAWSSADISTLTTELANGVGPYAIAKTYGWPFSSTKQMAKRISSGAEAPKYREHKESATVDAALKEGMCSEEQNTSVAAMVAHVHASTGVKVSKTTMPRTTLSCGERRAF